MPADPSFKGIDGIVGHTISPINGGLLMLSSYQVPFNIYPSFSPHYFPPSLTTLFGVHGLKVAWKHFHRLRDGLLPELPFAEWDYTILSLLLLLLRLLLLSLLARGDEIKRLIFFVLGRYLNYTLLLTRVLELYTTTYLLTPVWCGTSPPTGSLHRSMSQEVDSK